MFKKNLYGNHELYRDRILSDIMSITHGNGGAISGESNELNYNSINHSFSQLNIDSPLKINVLTSRRNISLIKDPQNSHIQS